MQLKGVSIDFDDRRTCALLPKLCLQWDEKYEELEDNADLLQYWEDGIQNILKTTTNIVSGNMGTKSIVYSAEEKIIQLIQESFKDLELETIEYEDILRCEHCIKYDYLYKNFKD